MQRRVMGMETEHGHIMFTPEGDSVFETLNNLADSSGQFLRNGARAYLDVQEHFEYATPECDTLDDLVNHVLAGRLLMADWARRFEKMKSRLGRPRRLAFFIGNVCNYHNPDGGESTYGCHENYQVQTRDLERFAKPLVAFLATRQIFQGEGRYVLNPNGTAHFEMAQRSGFTSDVFSEGTTGNSKPLVNLRDEPLAGSTKRLHLICGDSNILPQCIWLRFGIMDVLLAMREDNLLKGVYLSEPVKAAKGLSRSLDFPIALNDARKWTGLNIQRYYYEQACEYVAARDNQERRAVIAEWGRLLDAFERNDFDSLVGQIGWVTKQRLLERYSERKGEAAHIQCQRLDLAWAQIYGEGALAEKIVEKYSTVNWEKVQEAKLLPPKTTRAWVRGRAVAAGLTVGWDRIILANEALYLHDPLNSRLPFFLE